MTKINFDSSNSEMEIIMKENFRLLDNVWFPSFRRLLTDFRPTSVRAKFIDSLHFFPHKKIDGSIFYYYPT